MFILMNYLILLSQAPSGSRTGNRCFFTCASGHTLNCHFISVPIESLVLFVGLSVSVSQNLWLICAKTRDQGDPQHQGLSSSQNKASILPNEQ